MVLLQSRVALTEDLGRFSYNPKWADDKTVAELAEEGLEVTDLADESVYASRRLHSRNGSMQMEGLHRLAVAFVESPGQSFRNWSTPQFGCVVPTVRASEMREGRWVIADMRGKGGRVRTVAVPLWIKQGINTWLTAAELEDGRLLRAVGKSGKVLRGELSDWAVWSVVQQSARQIGVERFGAHDLRRTCAKLCRKSGGDLEQIKFLLGHSSIQTTERYLGSEQEIAVAVNDTSGSEPLGMG